MLIVVGREDQKADEDLMLDASVHMYLDEISDNFRGNERSLVTMEMFMIQVVSKVVQYI